MKRIIAAAVSVLLACSFAPGLAEDTLNAEKKPATTITEATQRMRAYTSASAREA